MSGLFWLNDKQWTKLEPLLPRYVRGKRRVDDRRVISGIIHVLRSGCRWSEAPMEYGPRKTLYNRFVRWAERGIWQDILLSLPPQVGRLLRRYSIARISKYTAQLPAEKGGLGTGHRLFSWRAEYQVPPHLRPARAAACTLSNRRRYPRYQACDGDARIREPQGTRHCR